MKKNLLPFFVFGLILLLFICYSCGFFYLASEDEYKGKNGIGADDNSNDDDDDNNGGGGTLSSNNNLKKLTFSEGVLEPSFNNSETKYELSVETEIMDIDLEATAEQSSAGIIIYDENSGRSVTEIRTDKTLVVKKNLILDTGYNSVTITVIAENGDKKDYTISVYRAHDPVIRLSEKTESSVTINWNPASSNAEKAGNWQYFAFYSEKANIRNIDDIKKNGNRYNTFGINYTNITVTGLKSGTIYYFNVLAVNKEERKCHYNMTGFMTKSVTVMTSAADSVIYERNEDRGEIVIQRNYAEGDLTVHYSLTGTAGQADYTSETALTGTVVIPDGDPSCSLFITAVNDILAETDETVSIELQEKADYVLGSETSVTITIRENTVPYNNLLRHYLLEEDAKDSAGGKDGIGYGVEFQGSKGTYFNGNDHIELPDINQEMKAAGEFTVSAKAKADVLDTISTQNIISNVGLPPAGSGRGFVLGFIYAQIDFHFYDRGWRYVPPTDGGSTEEYQTITGTWDGQYLKLYLNGELIRSSIDLSHYSPATTCNTLTIGDLYPDSNEGFNGYIRDVRIYNKALTEVEIGLIFGNLH